MQPNPCFAERQFPYHYTEPTLLHLTDCTQKFGSEMSYRNQSTKRKHQYVPSTLDSISLGRSPKSLLSRNRS